jgi:hypothetical protein
MRLIQIDLAGMDAQHAPKMRQIFYFYKPIFPASAPAPRQMGKIVAVASAKGRAPRAYFRI